MIEIIKNGVLVARLSPIKHHHALMGKFAGKVTINVSEDELIYSSAFDGWDPDTKFSDL